MTTSADDRLKALFAQDEPPARDPAFSAALMERMARRRCLQDLGVLALVSVLGAVGLWGIWPVIGPAMTAISGQLAPAAFALAIALSAVAVLGGRGNEAMPVES